MSSLDEELQQNPWTSHFFHLTTIVSEIHGDAEETTVFRIDRNAASGFSLLLDADARKVSIP